MKLGFETLANSRRLIYLGALAIFCAAGLKADTVAYIGSSSGAFGTMDLNTGIFTPLGNSGQTLAGLAVADGTLFATSYHGADGTLVQARVPMSLAAEFERAGRRVAAWDGADITQSDGGSE